MSRKAFTLVETMIAIMVFAVGILTVLRVMTQNTLLLSHSQDKIIASLLAKEGIDLVFNLKDTNIQQGIGRDCIPSTALFTATQIQESEACAHTFHDLAMTRSTLSLAYDPIHTFFVQVYAPIAADQLYSQHQLFMVHSGDTQIYSYQTGEQTIFSRYMSFTGVVDESGVTLPLDQVLQLQVHVDYQRGSRTGSVILDSFISAY